MRRLLVAGALALALCTGLVGYAFGQAADPTPDGDNQIITACVGGSNLNVSPPQRSWLWLNEALKPNCDPGYTKVDWVND